MGKLWIEQYGTVEITNHRYTQLAHTEEEESSLIVLCIDFSV